MRNQNKLLELIKHIQKQSNVDYHTAIKIIINDLLQIEHQIDNLEE